MSKNRARLFLENFLIFGVIAVIDRIIPLIMLPIITRIIKDTTDYGVYEVFNTIVQLVSYIVILGLYDAMFREYFEKTDDEDYKGKVTRTALTLVCISSIICVVLLVLTSKYISQLFFAEKSYGWIVCVAAAGALIAGFRTIFSAPTRMKNKRNVFAISGILSGVLHYALVIFFLKNGFLYEGLIWASIISNLCIVIFFVILNRKDFSQGKFDNGMAKKLLKIGLPLVPTFLSYWVYSAMDKIMISNIIGLAAVGIYSAGSKVAQISQLIYTAFAMGWQYFAFSTMNDKDQVRLTSRIFEYLGVISFAAFGFANLIDNWFFNIYFTGDYIQSVKVFPYLFLAPLILMLFQVGANQFLVYKKSYLSTCAVISGVLVNLVLNAVLIPGKGIVGAAFATLLGYFVSVIIMLTITISKKWMTVSPKFIGVATLLICNIVLLYCFGGLWNNICSGVLIVVCCALYFKNLINILKNMKKKSMTMAQSRQ